MRYKVIQLWVSGCGFAVVIISLWFNAYQVSINSKALRANVGHSVASLVTDMDKIFISNPELIPYFYSGESINVEDKQYQRAQQVAIMFLDVFDIVVTQNKHFTDQWEKPSAWNQWMIDVFSSSPILRDTFDEYQDWYGDNLKAIRMSARPKKK